jgi:hypothetical protein
MDSRCPKCKRPGLRQQVSVFVDCPASHYNLSKKGIRGKAVRIVGVGWPTAVYYCPHDGCGFLLRLGEEKKR